jgi:predicted TIM-barrel fold metal-dependent hydrolase
LLRDFELFDSHLHIIDARFPLVPNNGYLPEEFTTGGYLKRLSNYNLIGGAIVSGSFQGFDQSYLIATLKTLGPRFVGVTQLPVTVSDDEIINLNELGVRAIRFNVRRGGSEKLDHLSSMAHRVYELVGWHVELYADSSVLEHLQTIIVDLPSVSIDHLGLRKNGFRYLLNAAEKGVKIKATGFSRVDFDVESAIKELYSANPESLMFGTDLPSTRAPTPFQDEDFELVADALGEEAAKQVFSNNAIKFYNPAIS